MTHEQELIHWKNMVKLYKFDYLTGMKQRRDFEVETMHKLTNQKFWLAMFDVTGLHKVNRDKGFAAGDALIKQVATEIQGMATLWEVYRIGGDEFMALFFEEPDVDSIPNATGCSMHSNNFKSFGDLLDSVDRCVIDKKKSLGNRREDD